MKAEKLSLDGLMLIDLKSYKDDRGFFVERFKENIFADLGIKNNFVQDNFSRSAPRVLRGLHYQADPAQAKLVTCMRGKILDVAVDIRKNSKTFGQSVQVVLDGDNPQWLFMPAGFAHGFCVLENETADIFYKVDGYYNPKTEGCIVWNDPDIKIDWPVRNPLLSPKDQAGLTLKDYLKNPAF